MSERPTCNSCGYFTPYRVGDPFGRCRRLPPQPDNDADRTGRWPEVYREDWCGEHPGFAKWLEAKQQGPPSPAPPGPACDPSEGEVEG